MGETERFLTGTLPRLERADKALHDGDPSARLAMWSRNRPVTVFGAAMSANDPEDIETLFLELGKRFSNCTSFEIEVISAGAQGDLAYIAGLERTTASVNGEVRSYVLRVTQIFRREDKEWKVVHRHADALASEDSQQAMQGLRGST